VERKDELDAFNGSGNLGHDASRARANLAKDTKKSQELAAKDYREKAVDHARKRKPDKEGAATPSRKKTTKEPKKKTQKREERPQGERKVPVASDAHGCDHSGLLELLPLERKYLQAYVNSMLGLRKERRRRQASAGCVRLAEGKGRARRLLQLRACGTQHDSRGGTSAEAAVGLQNGSLHVLPQQTENRNGWHQQSGCKVQNAEKSGSVNKQYSVMNVSVRESMKE
jgi:hypothetical protein